MDAILGTTGQLESRADVGPSPSEQVGYWIDQLNLVEREEREFVTQGRKIVKRYRDDRGDAQRGASRMNILWSNVQTLIPALYGRTPKPDVQRRHLDTDSPGRLAALVLEGALDYTLDMVDFDGVMREVLRDRLLPGRGTAWWRYVADIDRDDAGEGVEVNGERLELDYVFWEDFRCGPARVWAEVPWIARRSYLNRDQLVSRFGAKTGKRVSLDYTPQGMSPEKGPVPDGFKRAVVWEIWDRLKREVVWIAPSTGDAPLDIKPDPLGLPGFYPCPQPLKATTTSDKQTPVADYVEYQDQALELDRITARIERLTAALKVAGVYAATEKAVLQDLLGESTENRLIPVEDWTGFAQQHGGIANMIQWLPIQQVAEVLIRLYDARDRVKQTLYEITGMADVLRGASNPIETATAQQIKSQFATLRMSDHQTTVARFARDLIRIAGHILALHFDPATISKMSGYPKAMPPAPQMPPPPVPKLLPAQHEPAPGQGAPMAQHPVGAGMGASPGPAQQPHPDPLGAAPRPIPVGAQA